MPKEVFCDVHPDLDPQMPVGPLEARAGGQNILGNWNCPMFTSVSSVQYSCEFPV